MAVELATAFVSIVPKTDGLGRKISEEIGGAPMDAPAKKTGGRFAGMFGKWAKRGMLAGGVAVGAAAGKTVVEGFKSALSQENSEKVLTGLYGSASKATSTIEKLRKVSRQSPIDFDSYESAASSLAYAGIQGDAAVGTLDKVGKAIVSTGGDGEKMQQAMGGVMKAVNNGGIAMMDSLNMISDSGVPILSGLAEHFGIGIDEVKKMASEGKVSIDDVMAVMENGTGDTFQQMIAAGEEASGSLKNQWARVTGNIKESLGKALIPVVKAIGPVVGKVGDGITSVIDGLTGGFSGVSEAMGPVLDNVRDGLQPAFDAFEPVVAAVVDGFKGLEGPARKVLDALKGLGENIIGALVPAFESIWEAAQPVMQKLGDVLAPLVQHAFGVIKTVISSVAPVIKQFGEWFKFAMGKIMSVVTPVIKIIAKNLQPVIEKAGKVIHGVFTTIQNVVKHAMGVVTGVVQTVLALFRGDWDAVFTGLGKTWSNLWRGVLDVVKGALSAVWGVVETVGASIAAVWNTIWNGVGAVWSRIWAQIKTTFRVPFEWIVNKINTGTAWIGTLWHNVWTTVADFFTGIWDRIRGTTKGAINGIKRVIQAVLTKIKSIWFQLWGAIKDKAAAIWEGIRTFIRDKITAVKTNISNVLGTIKSIWSNGWGAMRSKVRDIWGGIKNFIHDTWVKIKANTFDKLVHVVKNTIPKAFEKGKDGIKKAWDKVKKVAATPVKFVVDTVYNSGIRKIWNKVAGITGLTKLDPVDVSGWSRGGWTGPGAMMKAAGIVHADEFVIRKRSRRKIEREHPGLLDHMNRTGETGYAKGGRVMYPTSQRSISSGFGAGRAGGSHAGVDFPVPIGTAVRAALSGIVQKAAWNAVTGRTGKGMLLSHEGNRNTYYGHLSAFVAKVGQAVERGQIIAKSGNTGRSTGPHLHFETWSGGVPQNPVKYLAGAALPAAAANMWSGGGENDDDLKLTNALSKLKDLFSKVKKGITGAGGKNGWGGAIKGLGRKIIQAPIDKLKEFVGKVAPVRKLGMSGALENVKAHGGSARGQVKDVAAKYGWDSGAQWDAINWIINRESGWNPNAANPTSSARGLFQKMTSIHGPVESTPAGQAEWGLNYFHRRYGSPLAAKAFWEKHHWYAGGGRVSPVLYDKGGQLDPGTHLVTNRTGRPEYILPANVTDALMSGAGRGGDPLAEELNIYGPDAESVIRELRTERRRREILRGRI